MAEALESEGAGPKAVVLLDTYLPSRDLMQMALWLLRQSGDSKHSLVTVDDKRLTAMGAYLELFADWDPGTISSAVTLIRASERIGSADGPVASRAQAEWPLPHEQQEVPGDHFSMMTARSATTAAAVARALKAAALRRRSEIDSPEVASLRSGPNGAPT